MLELRYKWLVRAGAKLGAKQKARVAEINQRLATLATQFSQNVLKDEQSWRLVLERARPRRPARGAARSRRARADRSGPRRQVRHHAVALVDRAVPAVLRPPRSARGGVQRLDPARRDGRGNRQPRHHRRDRRAARRVRGAARLQDLRRLQPRRDDGQDAGQRARAADGGVGAGGEARRRASATRCRARAREEGGNFAIAPWDWRYYAEKVRKARFDVDEASTRPYLVLDNVIAAAFDTATRLFGLKFKELPDAPRYHPDVRVWEVTDKRGDHVGLFLGDYFARPSKRSGAWMSAFRSQSKVAGEVQPDHRQRHELRQAARRASRACSRSTTRARCSTSSATACTGCCRTSPIRRSPARR